MSLEGCLHPFINVFFLSSTVLGQFNKEHGDIHEAKLKVIYSAPAQPPSPVAESSEEGPLGAAEVIEDSGMGGHILSTQTRVGWMCVRRRSGVNRGGRGCGAEGCG